MTLAAADYERDGIRLWRADMLHVLPELPAESVDLLVTDPPYSSGGFTRGDRLVDPAGKYVQSGVDVVRASFAGDNRDARSWCFWMALWLSAAAAALRTGGYALVFCDWRQLPIATDAFQAGGFVWRGVIAWDKTEGSRAPHCGYFRHQCEYVIWGTKGPCSTSGSGPWPGCIRQPVLQNDKFHMTGKPTALMRELIRCVPEGALVLDPFMGSGTTALACLQTGRRCIGIELSQDYFKVAAGRLEGQHRDEGLFHVDRD